jgi:TRAP-type mannitol/chloroaromatic compound transport system substrate-binding protein
LDKGVVDAADWGTTSMNVKLGLHDAAKYYLDPSFHSMSALEFTVSKKHWEELDPDVQAMLHTAVREWSLNTMERIMIEDIAAERMLAQKGIKKVSLSEADYRKIRQMAQDVWLDWAKKSPLCEQIINSQVAWAKELGLL